VSNQLVDDIERAKAAARGEDRRRPSLLTLAVWGAVVATIIIVVGYGALLGAR
jgi:hypothetical protein